MPKEILVTCPLCSQRGFTPRGLRAHRCPKNNSKALSYDYWREAVDAAEAKQHQKTKEEV